MAASNSLDTSSCLIFCAPAPAERWRRMRGGGEIAPYCVGEFGGRIIAIPQAIIGFRTTPLFHQRSNPLPPPSLAKQLYQARPDEQSAIGSLRNVCALRVASFLTLIQTQVRNHSFAALPGSTAALPPTDPPLSERLPISSSDFGAITGAISVKLQCRTLVGRFRRCKRPMQTPFLSRLGSDNILPRRAGGPIRVAPGRKVGRAEKLQDLTTTGFCRE